MNEEINSVKVNYKLYGKKSGDTLVFLHGWGQNIEMMRGLADPFSETHQILIIDLPGFGESTEPTYPWKLDDYLKCIKELIDMLKIKSPTVIGHSFGGKLALMYAATYETKKLVVFGSPVNHNLKGLSLKTKFLKTVKKLPGIEGIADFAKKYIGSEDYKKATKIMRQIMVNHVNTDIYDMLKKIKCPTLIVWGTNDTAVIIEVAKMLEKEINNAGLVVYEGCTHYAYLERLDQTVNVLKSFLGE